PRLLAVDDPAAASRDRLRPEGECVATRIWLGYPEAEPQLPPSDSRQELPLLLFSPIGPDRVCAEATAREEHRPERRHAPGKFFYDQDHIHDAAAIAAVLLGDRQSEPACLGHPRP